jgi:hypothetical protein
MQARTATTLTQGVTAGIVAYVAIALVLGGLDLLGGRGVLYSPALLGSVLLEGGADGCQLQFRSSGFWAYTSIHLVMLMLFGLLAGWLIRGSEERPTLWFGALLTFVMVAWHLTGAVLGLLAPVQACLSLWSVTAAGFAGALAMAAYLWWTHPRLRRALRGERYA